MANLFDSILGGGNSERAQELAMAAGRTGLDVARMATPFYNPILHWLFQNAGLDPRGLLSGISSTAAQAQFGQEALQRQMDLYGNRAAGPIPANTIQEQHVEGGHRPVVFPAPAPATTAQTASQPSIDTTNFVGTYGPPMPPQTVATTQSIGWGVKPPGYDPMKDPDPSALPGGDVRRGFESGLPAAPVATAAVPSPTPTPAPAPQLPGIFNLPNTRLQMQAAEEDIAGQRQRAVNAALADMQRRGIRGPAAAAAVGRAYTNADADFARYRRDLALKADAEQERRLGALLQALGMGFGQAAPAGQIFGGAANANTNPNLGALLSLGAAFA